MIISVIGRVPTTGTTRSMMKGNIGDSGVRLKALSSYFMKVS